MITQVKSNTKLEQKRQKKQDTKEQEKQKFKEETSLAIAYM